MLNITELGIRIFKDKVADGLTFREIGKKHNITPSNAQAHYKLLKQINREGDYTWLNGLSHRAQNQIKRTNYKDFATLNHDVVNGLVDLEDFPWIGHKVACEITRWLRFSNDRRKRERRNHAR